DQATPHPRHREGRRQDGDEHARGPGSHGEECGGDLGDRQRSVGPRTARPRLSHMDVSIRQARTADVRAIRRLIDTYSADRRLLSKATVALYEDIQEFWVADAGGDVVGCGAVHVLWEDLAEVRTVAVDPDWHGRTIGHRLVAALLDTARD